MDAVAPAAQTLSTYGLYAITTALVIVVIYLYKRQIEIEKEFRAHLEKNAQNFADNTAEMAKLVLQTTNVISKNTRVLQRVLDRFNGAHFDELDVE